MDVLSTISVLKITDVIPLLVIMLSIINSCCRLALFHCGIVEPLIALGLGVDENNGVSPEDVNEGQDALMNLYNEGKNEDRDIEGINGKYR